MGPSVEYEVLATRVRDWWYIEVEDLGVLAECRRFVEVESAARVAIASHLKVDGQSFGMSIELRPGLEDMVRVGGRRFVGSVNRRVDGFLHVS